jgi:hypothetical protein
MEKKLWRKPKSLSNKIGVTAKVLNMLFSLINMENFQLYLVCLFHLFNSIFEQVFTILLRILLFEPILY